MAETMMKSSSSNLRRLVFARLRENTGRARERRRRAKEAQR
eukprot:gene7174-49436_t